MNKLVLMALPVLSVFFALPAGVMAFNEQNTATFNNHDHQNQCTIDSGCNHIQSGITSNFANPDGGNTHYNINCNSERPGAECNENPH